jgi:subtilase family serine protease
MNPRRHRRAGSRLAMAFGAVSLLGGSLGLTAAARASAAPPTAAPPAAARVGSVPVLPSGTRRAGTLAPFTRIRAVVALAPRDPGTLSRYVTAVSTPGTAEYRHYLSPAQFAARFGPSASAVAAARSVLRQDGLDPGAISVNHLSINIDGTAAQLSTAFDTTFARYAVPDGRTTRSAFAATRAPLIPGSIVGDVQGVIGLDNVAQAQPLGLVRPTRNAATGDAGPVQPLVTAGGPQPCAEATTDATQYGYDEHTYDQLAAAYGFTNLYSAGDLGQGQTVALYELEPNLTSDVAAFQSCYGTSATVNYTEVDGGPGSTGAGSGEAALDIDNIIGLAPQSTVDVYQGPNGGEGPYDVYSDIIGTDTAKVISTSWGFCEPDGNSGYFAAENSLFEEAAAQGQTVLAAAGDDGSEDCNTSSAPSDTVAVDDPASQPYVTGVGGTALETLGPPPTETAWNEYSLGEGAGGGGISTAWPMPAYQTNAPGSLNVINDHSSSAPCDATSSDCREVPDVSADADPQYGYMIYYNGSWTPIGGTSAAAPLWGAFVALTNASSSCAGTDIGFANPALYAIAGRSESAYFHDVTSGNNDYTGTNSGSYPAGPGYDMATGLGTPNGAALPAALCSAGTSSVPSAPTGTQATAGNSRVTLSWPAPSSTGGSAVTGYDVYEGTTARGESATPVNASPVTGTTYTITGLTNGTTYYFTVKGINDVGSSAPSNEASATPRTVPGAPRALKATRGNASAALAWQAPASTGGSPVTGYDVYRGATLLTAPALAPTVMSYTAKGLTNGTTYSFTVVALNAAGRSPASAPASVTPATVPGAPTKARATAGVTEVVLSWVAPASDGGSAVTGYEVYEGTVSGHESTKPVNATPLSAKTTTTTVKGLKAGTRYYFEIRAVNVAGKGPASAQVSATPTKAATLAALGPTGGPARFVR